MGIFGSILGSAFGQVFDFVAQWVAAGAAWLLTQVGHVMSSTTTVDLGSSWFTEHERALAAISAAVILPMACCGAIVAVYRQDASALVRGFLVKLPLALLLTGVSVELVRMGLTVTDQLSAYVLHVGNSHTTDVFGTLAVTLSTASALPGVPFFVVFLSALLLAICALVLWLELVVRAAAVAAATLFLPLALAGLVWPVTAHWCRRLGETIAALVLSKLVVAAVLSLAASAASAGIAGPGDTSGGFSSVVVGIALLAIATASPFVLLRLVPAIESGAMLHLESSRHRLQHMATAPYRAADMAMMAASGAGLLFGRASSAGSAGTGGGPPAVGAAPAVGGDGGASHGDDAFLPDVGTAPRPTGGIPDMSGETAVSDGGTRGSQGEAARSPGTADHGSRVQPSTSHVAVDHGARPGGDEGSG